MKAYIAKLTFKDSFLSTKKGHVYEGDSAKERVAEGLLEEVEMSEAEHKKALAAQKESQVQEAALRDVAHASLNGKGPATLKEARAAGIIPPAKPAVDPETGEVVAPAKAAPKEKAPKAAKPKKEKAPKAEPPKSE